MPDTVLDGPSAPALVAALRPLSRRRGLVVALGLVVVAGGVGTWFSIPVATLGASAVFIAGYVLLRRTIDDVADKPDGALDERLVGLRNTAYLQAYRIFGVLVAFALLVLFIAADSSDLDVTPAHVQTLFLTALATSSALPSMVIAWSEREV